MSGRRTMFALAGLVVTICAACLWPTDAERLEGPGISIDPQAMLDSTGLGAAGDNFTWQNHPNQNNGTLTEMRTGVASTGRAFVRWTQATIDSVVGSGTLVSARLDITINSSSGWSGTAGLLSIHRVTKDWTELGSTANCAIDTNTGNDQADCSGATVWVLNNPPVAPWIAAPTDSLGVSNGQTGKISFNVTTDLQAFLNDTANYGWVIKPKNDAAAGDVRLRSQEAASDQPVLVITVDQAWPELTSQLPQFDTTLVVQVQADSDTVAYFRTEVQVRFRAAVSLAAKNAFFAAHSMTVIGVTVDSLFFVRMPDPGPTLQAYNDTMTVLRADPSIYVVVPILRTPMRSVKEARYPTDGPGQGRTDWLSGSTATWALRAIRAPIGWGCETGDYGSKLVKVGVFEWQHQPSHPDFSRSAPVPWAPTDAELSIVTPSSVAEIQDDEKHASGVTGVLSAEGDNGVGSPG